MKNNLASIVAGGMTETLSVEFIRDIADDLNELALKSDIDAAAVLAAAIGILRGAAPDIADATVRAAAARAKQAASMDVGGE